MKKNNILIESIIKKTTPKRQTLKNMGKAFITGGTICLIAQAFNSIFLLFLNKTNALSLTIILMIFLGSVFTGLGLYDKLGQFAGAGSIIPITGFANSMTSCALESKSEGIVLGIINNMFKLAGSVIVTAVISGFIFSSLYFILGI